MPVPFWSAAKFGCIERDSFALHPSNRTALTSIAGPPMRTKKSDAAAPITATLSCNQTLAQWSAFTQWHRVDLAVGARPFVIDLWLYDHTRRVRARFVGPWSATRMLFDAFVLHATIEIERESIS